MAEVVSTQQWTGCPACCGRGIVGSVVTTAPPVTCPRCHGECRVPNIWYGVDLTPYQVRGAHRG